MSKAFGYDLIEFRKGLYKQFGLPEDIRSMDQYGGRYKDYVVLLDGELRSLDITKDQMQIIELYEVILSKWKELNNGE